MTEGNTRIGSAKSPAWRVVWPAPFKLWMILTAFFLSLAALLGLHSVVFGIRNQDWGNLIGGAAFAVGMSMLGRVAFGLAGLSRSSVPRSVVAARSDQWGAGLLLRCRSSRYFAVPVLAFAVWAITAAVVQFRGMSESLLPSSRDNDVGGVLVLGGAVVILAFLVLLRFRTRTDVSLYPDGILRQARRRRLLRSECVEEFLRWEDIDEVKVDTHDVHTAYSTVKNPIIRLVSSSLDPSRKLKRFDTEDSMALRAYELGAEPNAIMALVLWCHENLWARERLAREDARELLHAPPLRERLRLSREAVKKPQ
ncbi:hypothetical protein [Rhodococcoides yunnanense]|uniref:hypothetical protein n=1 Tax=Rhodococcoides yunnanense TaxID=278209 RepID=UPI0022B08BB5|nr:hypothetical protein [Rhodococcus yunnanensis]MCZ4278997.1 hypothetical protein [Rhodococcus yunnanensis]